jgi:hypothetical protein
MGRTVGSAIKQSVKKNLQYCKELKQEVCGEGEKKGNGSEKGHF